MTDDDRLADLLTEKLERELSPEERKELDLLLSRNPGWRRGDLAYAAAAVHLALEPGEDMPDDVKARLIGKVLGEALSAERPRDVTVPLRQVPDNVIRGPWRARAVAPWLAAAAAVFIAVAGWWPRLDQGPSRDELARDPGAVKVAWAQTQDPLGKAVAGDVVWSPAKQAGFMRFQGLPANDPRVAQYQLWIFDAERDQRYPVDGGVFDVGPGGETVVAIHAKVPVGKVALFAVTLEKPGGVVVSTRERLVALGKVG